MLCHARQKSLHDYYCGDSSVMVHAGCVAYSSIDGHIWLPNCWLGVGSYMLGSLSKVSHLQTCREPIQHTAPQTQLLVVPACLLPQPLGTTGTAQLLHLCTPTEQQNYCWCISLPRNCCMLYLLSCFSLVESSLPCCCAAQQMATSTHDFVIELALHDGMVLRCS